jgi:hypothetical protein
LSIVVAMVGVGCDPVFTLRGSVCEDTDAAEPIEDAKLSVFCPRDGQFHQFYPTFSTDAQGKFDYQHIGELPLECELRAQKEGFQLVDVPLGEECIRKRGDRFCAEADFDFELASAQNAHHSSDLEGQDAGAPDGTP